MHIEITNNSFSFQLRNIALLSFEKNEEYVEVISPFSRIYLINEGSGSLEIEGSVISLEPGFIYLIPSFVSCSYFFQKGLSHFYVHFSIDHPNGLSPYLFYSVVHKVKATELDTLLFQRLLEINPDLELPHHDPNVYQKISWLNRKIVFSSGSRHLETVGILSQVFSRYTEIVDDSNSNELARYNFDKILLYVQANIDRNIKVEDLADIACFSKDHFSRVFKSIVGFSPGEYILQKRLEKAKFLLLSTNLPQKEIIDRTGFNSIPYFSRIFKKYSGCSPNSYRRKRG
jgi:AraC-like DNA-binding protein